MSEDSNVPVWRVIGQSVQGASHMQTGRPNQDAIDYLPISGKDTSLIVAVADGHGSAKCFRSHIGADAAVRAATAVLQELLDTQPNLSDFLAFRQKAVGWLPLKLFSRWETMVEVNIHDNPFTLEELEELENKVDPGARQEVENNPNLAYGTTILAVLLTRSLGFICSWGTATYLPFPMMGR